MRDHDGSRIRWKRRWITDESWMPSSLKSRKKPCRTMINGEARGGGTLGQNSQESGHKYWATRSLAPLTYSLASQCSLTPELMGKCRCLKTTWFGSTVGRGWMKLVEWNWATVLRGLLGGNGEKEGKGRKWGQENEKVDEEEECLEAEGNKEGEEDNQVKQDKNNRK